MKILGRNWLGAKYGAFAAYVADALFFLVLLSVKVVIPALSFFCLLFVVLSPAFFLWQFLWPMAASAYGKVFFAVIWTSLWVVSILLMNCLLGPVIESLSGRFFRLMKVIDAWEKKEGLSKD